MKSAWEIAMEKAEKLGKPSPEEIAKRREETFVPAGEALAKKYLAGLPVRDLQIELDRYKGEDLNVVVSSLLRTLKAAISLDSLDTANRVLEAWRLLSSSSGVESAGAVIRNLIESYRRARSEAEKKLAPLVEEDLTRELAAEGIAGTAVVINPKKSRVRPGPLEEAGNEYAARLEVLKEDLAPTVGPAKVSAGLEQMRIFRPGQGRMVSGQ